MGFFPLAIRAAALGLDCILYQKHFVSLQIWYNTWKLAELLICITMANHSFYKSSLNQPFIDVWGKLLLLPSEFLVRYYVKKNVLHDWFWHLKYLSDFIFFTQLIILNTKNIFSCRFINQTHYSLSVPFINIQLSYIFLNKAS